MPSPSGAQRPFWRDFGPLSLQRVEVCPIFRPVGRSHRTVYPSGWQPQRFTHPGLKAYFRRLATVDRRFAQSLFISHFGYTRKQQILDLLIGYLAGGQKKNCRKLKLFPLRLG
jgi:hypothetical protein